jgi:hypothetical protein
MPNRARPKVFLELVPHLEFIGRNAVVRMRLLNSLELQAMIEHHAGAINIRYGTLIPRHTGSYRRLVATMGRRKEHVPLPVEKGKRPILELHLTETPGVHEQIRDD